MRPPSESHGVGVAATSWQEENEHVVLLQGLHAGRAFGTRSRRTIPRPCAPSTGCRSGSTIGWSARGRDGIPVGCQQARRPVRLVRGLATHGISSCGSQRLPREDHQVPRPPGEAALAQDVRAAPMGRSCWLCGPTPIGRDTKRLAGTRREGCCAHETVLKTWSVGQNGALLIRRGGASTPPKGAAEGRGSRATCTPAMPSWSVIFAALFIGRGLSGSA